MAVAVSGPNWWDNPGIKNLASDALTDLSYGLANSRNLNGAFSTAATQSAVQQPAREAYQVAQADKASREQQLQTAIANLRDKYKRPDLADAVSQGYDLNQAWNDVLNKQAAPALTTDQSNYEYGLTHPGFADSLTQKGGAAETALTPTWITDTDPQSPTYNQPVLGQLNKAGQLIRTALPNGVQAMGPGDAAALKTNATVDAKTAAAARATLPSAENAYQLTQQALANFDAGASSDAAKSVQAGMGENFGNVLGIPQQVLPIIPKTNRANFQNVVDQLSGQAFLNIRQALKGAGQVTDYEGAKGEIALSRMAAAAKSGDEPAFKQALLDYKEAIDNGLRLLRETANGGYAQGSQNVTGTAGNVASTGISWSYAP